MQISFNRNYHQKVPVKNKHKRYHYYKKDGNYCHRAYSELSLCGAFKNDLLEECILNTSGSECLSLFSCPLLKKKRKKEKKFNQE